MKRDRIASYLAAGKIHSGLILAAPESEDRWKVAMGMAAAILCPNSKEGRGCGKCTSCAKVLRESHPDLLIYREPEESIIKIETIRGLTQSMLLTPVESRARVCIVDRAERMNPSSGNAFLKSLEEPGPSRHFILLAAQTASLLPTIVSRCLRFTLAPTGLDEAPALEPAVRMALDGFLGGKEIDPLLDQIETKEAAKQLVGSLLHQAHRSACSAEPWRGLMLFESLLELEGRLRSQANYGLMLEVFLNQNRELLVGMNG